MAARSQNSALLFLVSIVLPIIGAPGPAKLGPGGTDSPCFIMVQDCLWNSKEHIVGDLSPPVPGDVKRDNLNKGLAMVGYLIFFFNLLLYRSPGTGYINAPIMYSSPRVCNMLYDCSTAIS